MENKMATHEEFQTLYETNLKPQLIEFENQRKNIVKKFVPVLIGSLVLMLLLLTVFITGEEDSYWPLASLFSMVVIGIGADAYYSKLVSPYEKNFKTTIISRIVSFIDENLTYYPDKSITLSEFRASRLESYWHSVDRWFGEDSVEGVLGKTAVKFSEVNAQYETKHTDKDGNRKTRYHHIFKGLFFIFDFNKDFDGFTVVLPDYAERRLGCFGKMLQSWKANIVPGELVKLADPEFEREFVVYSDNQITARYVLSTNLMRRLLTFRQQLNKRVYLSFVNGKLYMGIPVSKDLFEPTVFKTLLNVELIQDFFNYMQLGKDIVEELNLNTRIWSKQ
jgi:hypothetical protein